MASRVLSKSNTIRKYLVAALAPLITWGVNALIHWSVTRTSLAVLILAEAVALGVYAIPNAPAP